MENSKENSRMKNRGPCAEHALGGSEERPTHQRPGSVNPETEARENSKTAA